MAVSRRRWPTPKKLVAVQKPRCKLRYTQWLQLLFGSAAEQCGRINILRPSRIYSPNPRCTVAPTRVGVPGAFVFVWPYSKLLEWTANQWDDSVFCSSCGTIGLSADKAKWSNSRLLVIVAVLFTCASIIHTTVLSIVNVQQIFFNPVLYVCMH